MQYEFVRKKNYIFIDVENVDVSNSYISFIVQQKHIMNVENI